MNWIDAIILIVFLYFIVTAFSAGFIREVIGIASAVLGIVLAGLFYEDIADTLLTGIDNQTTANVIAFLGILALVGLSGQAIAMLVKPAVTVMQLGVFDQLAGAVLGAMKAFVLIEIVLILFVTYPRYHLDTRIAHSEFAPKLLDGAQPILKVLPDIFEAKVSQFNSSS
ncbi:MAG TPA: CvpA family protein [Dehalococcoidia bacterium]|nr:CvpA family protein [Dehalococcoidia bacterium]